MSIREVARRVDRDVQAVHRDVTTLINAGIVDRTENGVEFSYGRIHFEFEIALEFAIADTGSQLNEQVGSPPCPLAPHLTVLDKLSRTDGAFSRSNFTWDAENDRYIYPAGKELKQSSERS